MNPYKFSSKYKDINPLFGWQIKKIGSVWALFCFVLLLLTCTVQSQSKTGVIAGIKSTYWDRYVHVGSLFELSERVSIYGTVEVGGGEYNIKPLSVLTFPIGKYIKFGFILGADVQIYQPTPTAEETITYLSTATGILATIQLTKELSLLGTFEYRQNDAVQNNTRFGIGAVFWFPTN